MSCSGRQPSESKKDLGEGVADFDPGGGRPEGIGTFFKAVTQAVLFRGVETWVLQPRMERALSIFQHRVVRRLTGRQLRRRGGGSWEYPVLENTQGPLHTGL